MSRLSGALQRPTQQALLKHSVELLFCQEGTQFPKAPSRRDPSVVLAGQREVTGSVANTTSKLGLRAGRGRATSAQEVQAPEFPAPDGDLQSTAAATH